MSVNIYNILGRNMPVGHGIKVTRFYSLLHVLRMIAAMAICPSFDTTDFAKKNFTLRYFCYLFPISGGPLMVAQWLGYCATNRKVAGSIPDGVIGIFH
jgi:hypothetical protein